MNLLKTIKRFISIALIIVLLQPISIQLFHAFHHDTHTHCIKIGDTHFHEKKFNCSISDFIFSSAIDNPEIVFSVLNIDFAFIKNSSVYHFLSQHQTHQSHLRGPPNHILSV